MARKKHLSRTYNPAIEQQRKLEPSRVHHQSLFHPVPLETSHRKHASKKFKRPDHAVVKQPEGMALIQQTMQGVLRTASKRLTARNFLLFITFLMVAQCVIPPVYAQSSRENRRARSKNTQRKPSLNDQDIFLEEPLKVRNNTVHIKLPCIATEVGYKITSTVDVPIVHSCHINALSDVDFLQIGRIIRNAWEGAGDGWSYMHTAMSTWANSANAKFEVNCYELHPINYPNAYHPDTNKVSLVSSLQPFRYTSVLRHEVGVHAANELKFGRNKHRMFELSHASDSALSLPKLLSAIEERLEEYRNLSMLPLTELSNRQKRKLGRAVRAVSNVDFTYLIPFAPSIEIGLQLDEPGWEAEVIDIEEFYQNDSLQMVFELHDPSTNSIIKHELNRMDYVSFVRELSQIGISNPNEIPLPFELELEAGNHFFPTLNGIYHIVNYSHQRGDLERKAVLKPRKEMDRVNRLIAFLTSVLNNIGAIRESIGYKDYPNEEIVARLCEYDKDALDFFCPELVQFLEKSWGLNTSDEVQSDRRLESQLIEQEASRLTL